MVKVVAFLPVKGTSERIKNKNLQLLNGKPLFLHTLEKIASCDFIDEVYLDSESEKIFELASEIKCKKLKRDKSLANNKTDGNKLFMNEIKQVEADIYIQILCTSPFITKETIKKGIDLLKKTINNKSKYRNFIRKVEESKLAFSAQQTLFMYKQRLSIKEIALKKLIKESTVWEHLANLIEYKQISVWNILSKDKICRILERIYSRKDRLRDIKKRLNDSSISFDEIACVMASVKSKTYKCPRKR